MAVSSRIFVPSNNLYSMRAFLLLETVYWWPADFPTSIYTPTLARTASDKFVIVIVYYYRKWTLWIWIWERRKAEVIYSCLPIVFVFVQWWLIDIILTSCWRNDHSFTYVNNNNSIVNVCLDTTPDKPSVQLLQGHEVLFLLFYKEK